MGHDIMARNKDGDTIGYLRYSMWDTNSYEIYELLDAVDYHAGVSGNGWCTDFTTQQIEKAIKNYDKEAIVYSGNQLFEDRQQDDIWKFLTSCLEEAQKEQTVQICFA